MCYNQTGDISTLEGTPLKLVDKFTYLGSSVESTEKNIETRLTKAWTATNRLSIIWKSDLTDKMKRTFFQAAVTSILLYGCTTWTLTKRLEKKLDGNYTRMLRAILNKSWQQHPTRHQLYGHLPPITKTIQVRRTRHAGHCWRSRDELIRDVLLWIPTHGRAKAGRPVRTYIQQLCEDTGCCPEDLPRAMNDREEWRERVRDIRAASTIWWWWWLALCEMQPVSSRIWTRVAVFISYDDNHYITGTSNNSMTDTASPRLSWAVSISTKEVTTLNKALELEHNHLMLISGKPKYPIYTWWLLPHCRGCCRFIKGAIIKVYYIAFRFIKYGYYMQKAWDNIIK